MKCPECGSFNSVLDPECTECGVELTAEHTSNEATLEEDSEPVESHPVPRSGVTTGQRIAGGLMLLAGAITIGVRLYAPALAVRTPFLVVGGALNMAMGGGMLAGIRKVVPIAILVMALGAVATLALRDVAILTASAFNCATCLLLLVGVASRGRIIAGCVMFLLSATVPFAVVRFAPNRVQPPGMVRVPELGTSVQALTGAALDYKVALPGDGWNAISRGAKERITPRSDTVAMNRITGAAARVYVDLKPGITPSSRTYLDGIIERLAKQTAPAERVGELQAYVGRSRVARVSWEYEGVLWTGFCATVVGNGWGIELDASAPTPLFAALEHDLRTIIDSLRISDEALKPPGEMAVTQSKKFAEPGSPFQLELAGDGWHDTPAKEMKRELGPNSKVRGWKQPYLGTHLYAWHEGADGVKLDPGTIVADWLRNLERDGKKTRRITQHEHPAGKRAWLQEVEMSSNDATSTAWLLVLVTGGDVVFTTYEVPANVRDELRPNALAMLGSVRFSK